MLTLKNKKCIIYVKEKVVIFLGFQRLYSSNDENNTVIINKDFFKALFINQCLKNNRTLSSVSLRLAALLLQELDDVEAKELPPRKRLAEYLQTSRTSVINALVQLEENNVIIRQVSIIQAIVGPSDEEKDRYYKIGQENLKQRKFSDKFLINRFYNQEYKPIDQQEFTKEIINYSNENLNNYITTECLVNKIQDLEKRIKKLEEKSI